MENTEKKESRTVYELNGKRLLDLVYAKVTGYDINNYQEIRSVFMHEIDLTLPSHRRAYISSEMDMDDNALLYQIRRVNEKIHNKTHIDKELKKQIIYVDFSKVKLEWSIREIFSSIPVTFDDETEYENVIDPETDEYAEKPAYSERLIPITQITKGEVDNKVFEEIKIKFSENEEAVTFIPFIKSQSMARHQRITYIDKELIEKHGLWKRLNLDFDFFKLSVNLSKFYAYSGLYLSSAKRAYISAKRGDMPLNEKTVIILPDVPNRDNIYESADYYITNRADTRNGHIIIEEFNKPGEEETDDSERKMLKIETPFDGEGIISPRYAELLSKKIGKHGANSFQIRMPFIKGMLHQVDFKEFVKEIYGETLYDSLDKNGGISVTDCFGIERNLLDAEIILTESMFKAAGWIKDLDNNNLIDVKEKENNTKENIAGEKIFDPVKLYFKKFRKYDHALYVSGDSATYTGYEATPLNWQFLSTLALKPDDVSALLDKHLEYVDDPLLSVKKVVIYEKNNDDENCSSEEIDKSPVEENESDDENKDLTEENESDDNKDLSEENESDDDTGESGQAKQGDDPDYMDESYPDSWYRVALENKDNDLINHPYIQKKLKMIAESRVKDIAYGRLILDGEVRYLSRDLLAFLKNILEFHYMYLDKEMKDDRNTLIYEKAEEVLKDVLYESESSLNKELLIYNEFYMPDNGITYNDGRYYPIFRNPHLSREEQCLLKSLNYNEDSLREKYLGELKSVLMVSAESFAPDILGGADFDGDIVKVYDNDRIRDAVIRGCYKESDNGDYVRKLPIVKITPFSNNYKNIPQSLRVDYTTIRNTFSSRVGLISYRAEECAESIYQDENYIMPDYGNMKTCAWYTIATGLEIDACKTGIHPDIDSFYYNSSTDSDNGELYIKNAFFDDLFNNEIFAYGRNKKGEWQTAWNDDYKYNGLSPFLSSTVQEKLYKFLKNIFLYRKGLLIPEKLREEIYYKRDNGDYVSIWEPENDPVINEIIGKYTCNGKSSDSVAVRGKLDDIKIDYKDGSYIQFKKCMDMYFKDQNRRHNPTEAEIKRTGDYIKLMGSKNKEYIFIIPEDKAFYPLSELPEKFFEMCIKRNPKEAEEETKKGAEKKRDNKTNDIFPVVSDRFENIVKDIETRIKEYYKEIRGISHKRKIRKELKDKADKYRNLIRNIIKTHISHNKEIYDQNIEEDNIINSIKESLIINDDIKEILDEWPFAAKGDRRRILDKYLIKDKEIPEEYIDYLTDFNNRGYLLVYLLYREKQLELEIEKMESEDFIIKSAGDVEKQKFSEKQKEVTEELEKASKTDDLTEEDKFGIIYQASGYGDKDFFWKYYNSDMISEQYKSTNDKQAD